VGNFFHSNICFLSDSLKKLFCGKHFVVGLEFFFSLQDVTINRLVPQIPEDSIIADHYPQFRSTQQIIQLVHPIYLFNRPANKTRPTSLG